MIETPDGPAKLAISRKRVRALQLVLWRTIDSGILRPGEASSLAGKCGFALTAAFGCVGRAKLRPISEQCYRRDGRLNLRPQLRSCLLWWTQFLLEYTRRQIPTTMTARPLVVSYSDGEGDTAGVGVCVFSDRTPHPVAAFAEGPSGHPPHLSAPRQ